MPLNGRGLKLLAELLPTLPYGKSSAGKAFSPLVFGSRSLWLNWLHRLCRVHRLSRIQLRRVQLRRVQLRRVQRRGGEIGWLANRHPQGLQGWGMLGTCWDDMLRHAWGILVRLRSHDNPGALGMSTSQLKFPTNPTAQQRGPWCLPRYQGGAPSTLIGWLMHRTGKTVSEN